MLDLAAKHFGRHFRLEKPYGFACRDNLQQIVNSGLATVGYTDRSCNVRGVALSQRRAACEV